MTDRNEFMKSSISAMIYNNETVEANQSLLSYQVPTFSLAKYQFDVIKEYDINLNVRGYF